MIQRNAVDPLLNTQQITSSVNFSKRYGWGTVTLGGNRRQSLSDGSVQQLLPVAHHLPASIALGSNITWSPGLSFTNNTTSKTPLTPLVTVLPGGMAGHGRAERRAVGSPRSISRPRSDSATSTGRTQFQVADQTSTGRDSVSSE